MSRTRISAKIVSKLWGQAAGRCEYDGCNKPLWFDEVTKRRTNLAYVAHIVADMPSGPRGDDILSEELKARIDNLMLLCDIHHRLIDIEDVDGNPTELLVQMKARHETRIEMVTAIGSDRQSHVILYAANIGDRNAAIDANAAFMAMLPERYPARREPLILSLRNSAFRDREPRYWEFESENLARQFDSLVRPGINAEQIGHVSVFALAPQPLLILMGRLLGDICPADVYQLHREPSGWEWGETSDPCHYQIVEPESTAKCLALNLSLSAIIDNSRIVKVLGSEVAVWTLTINHPNNDFLRTKGELAEFRRVFRCLLNEIKMRNPNAEELHVFPAVPVAIAVEIGRVWMPKADLTIRIYDESAPAGGFAFALDIR